MSELRKKWLDSYRGSVSERDLALMDKASRILEENIAPQTEQLPWKPRRGILPSDGFPGVWNWDCAFIAMAVSRWDLRLGQEQAEIFYGLQTEAGLFPDYQHKDTGFVEDRFGKPPVWPWAVALLDRRCADDGFLQRSWEPLVKNETFWRTNRFHRRDGLFSYGAYTKGDKRELHIRYESGWDNSPRWDGGIEHIYPVDLNCFMVTFYRGMAYIAARLGKQTEAERYDEKGRSLEKKILQKLWDADRKVFADYDFKTKSFIVSVSPASFMPLWIGIATQAQADAMNAWASDPDKFFPGMPTVTYDDPKNTYNAYWRGPCWLNVAYFAVKGLYDYGHRKTAMAIRDTLLKWMSDDESIHENYDPKTGAPLRSPHFSWSAAFAIEMILEMK